MPYLTIQFISLSSKKVRAKNLDKGSFCILLMQKSCFDAIACSTSLLIAPSIVHGEWGPPTSVINQENASQA